MIIPITQRYNPNLPSIGSVEPTDRGLIVTLTQGLTRDQVFQIFGCAGIELLEVEDASESDLEAGIFRFKKFRIYEFTRPASYEPMNSIDEAVQKARIEGRADAFDELSRIHGSELRPRGHFADRRARELAKIDSTPTLRPIRPVPRPSGGKEINEDLFPTAYLAAFILLFVAVMVVIIFCLPFVDLLLRMK